MAGIRQGSYIVLSAVLEIMILVDKLFDKPFLKVLLAIMIFSTVFQVKPGQIHHGFIWPGSIWKTDWEPTPLPNGTLFLTKKQYFDLSRKTKSLREFVGLSIYLSLGEERRFL